LLIYGIKKLKLAGLRLERFDPEYSPLIPDPMNLGRFVVSGLCIGSGISNSDGLESIL